jgi:hypothetical protein
METRVTKEEVKLGRAEEKKGGPRPWRALDRSPAGDGHRKDERRKWGRSLGARSRREPPMEADRTVTEVWVVAMPGEGWRSRTVPATTIYASHGAAAAIQLQFSLVSVKIN